MKFANPVLLLTDADTGKAYARPLNQWEQNLVLQQLQALDGGALKLTEIAPCIIRGVNVSEERAQVLLCDQQQREARDRIVEKQQRLHLVAREGVDGLQQMANAHINAKLPPSLVDLDGARLDRLNAEAQEQKNAERLAGKFKAAKLPPAPTSPNPLDSDDPTAFARCYQCGEMTRQRLVGDEWHCKACHAIQCERETCATCGKVCTRPGGEHYCSVTPETKQGGVADEN